MNDWRTSISRFGDVRDQYLQANKENLTKKRNAIAGNRELVQKNQGRAINNLNEQVRNNIFNTNRSLGVLGAGNSSATLAASKALAQSAGRDRQGILTGYGDQMSQQNQDEQNAVEAANFQREQVIKWEQEQTAQAMREYEEAKSILEELEDEADDWEKEDIKSEQTARLQQFLARMDAIRQTAKAVEQGIGGVSNEFGASADALRAANIGIDRPAELDTPEFTDELDLGEAMPVVDEDPLNPNNRGREGEDKEAQRRRLREELVNSIR
jgi:hypothetical protein